MRVACLAIGDELLDGRVVDKNSRDLGDALSVIGLELCEARTVPDHRDQILSALRELLAHADVVVTSGGLGPTSDDITASCVAEVAGVPLRFDAGTMAHIEALFSRRQIPMPESNRRQAMVPHTATVLHNAHGTAPGLCTPFVDGGATKEVWCFPGVPHEFNHLLETYLLPSVQKRQGNKTLVRRTLRSLGLAESAIGERLATIERENPDVRVQYRAAYPEIVVRVVLEGADAQALHPRADALLEACAEAIGPSLWAKDDSSLEEALVALLTAQQHTIATAESCTGGLVAKRITDVAGSSAVMMGGVVAYDNRIKQALLGVPAALLDAHGAVSEPVALAMAEGAKRALNTTWAVSTTGIAGPGGGSPDKPVGTVCFAVVGDDKKFTFTKKLPDFGRGRVREMAAAVALRAVLDAARTKEAR